MNSGDPRAVKKLAAGAATTSILLTGCAGGTDNGPDGGSRAADVYAAASLRVAGDELAEGFREDGNEGELRFNYAGSSDLVRQISDGAPADVFISADEATMERAVDQNHWDSDAPEVVATNHLVLALPAGNPAGITSLADLSRDANAPRVALCAPEVPCGRIAGKVLGDNGIELSGPSEEANVAEVATKVSTGAVDAGFIYSTDARTLADDGVTTIDLPGTEPNAYPAALTPHGTDNPVAEEFTRWLTGEHAQRILAAHGFDAP